MRGSEYNDLTKFSIALYRMLSYRRGGYINTALEKFNGRINKQ